MKTLPRFIKSMLLMAVFSANTFAEEPARGNFGFQTVEPFNNHYFAVRVVADFGGLSLNGNALQSLGVNVYWKTKSMDPNRGRSTYTFTQSRLPRCPFTEERQCESGKISHDGTSEHVEAFVFRESGVDNNGIRGRIPSKANRITRFFTNNYRYANNGEDKNVNLGAVYFSQNSNNCKVDFCGDSQYSDLKPIPRSTIKPAYIYIPSNDLEYLVIETFGFEYTNKTMKKNDGFYTFPVLAVKYVPQGVDRIMNIQRSDWHSTTTMKEFSAFKNISEKAGYLDPGLTRINDNFDVVDFGKIDILDVKLKYNPNRPQYSDPLNTGIGVQIDKVDIHCDQTDSTCPYPKRY